MARMLFLLPVAVACFAAIACARSAPPARPLVTVTTSVTQTTTDPPSVEVTTTVVTTTTTTATRTTGKAQAACRQNEKHCHEPGTNTECQTGGCVNAGRGMTQRDVEKQRDEWLSRHPGWCAAGETGAVAPC